jgi:hypothetical protein
MSTGYRELGYLHMIAHATRTPRIEIEQALRRRTSA